MDHPYHWLAQNSPYRPHWVKKWQFSLTRCCKARPKPTDLEVWGLHPQTHIEWWFPVYQCRRCGKCYLWLDGKGKQMDSLLKYEVRKRNR